MRGVLLPVAGLVAALVVAACGLGASSGSGGGFEGTSSSKASGGGTGPMGGGPPVPTCTDGKHDGEETDVDCGGSCTPCAIGQSCQTSSDCVFACERDVCIAPPHPRWTDAVPAPMPPMPFRELHMAAYDAALGRTVLFGGTWNNSWLNDTWAYDGTAWSELNDGSQNAPPARYFGGMVYDAARSALVLFGGQSFDYLSDTWLYTGAGWAPGPMTGPSKRCRFAMAYDATRKVTVVFGGSNGDLLDETWEFDGTTWTQPMPIRRPAARYDAAAAFDPVSKRVLIYGGVGDAGTADPLADSWSWDGVSWTKQMSTPPTPGKRSGSVMATDALRGRVILFGGSDGAGFHDDTWEWAGAGWTLMPATPTPPSAVLNPLAFDDARHRAVLYMAWDGVNSPNQTWEYDVLATSCSKGADCGSGFCEDGLCCATKCGVCSGCNGRNSPGFCEPIVGKDDPDSCKGDHTCDASAKCVPK